MIKQTPDILFSSYIKGTKSELGVYFFALDL